jgi:pyruvate/2-oxoglutarate/acetoin dehydrogenase E1 component
LGAILVSYLNEITKAMAMLASDPRTLFVGQAVEYDGQRAHATFKDVPTERRIEMPVIEDFQMGFCTGLALEGYVPVCFFPRWDFAILAANQIINHLDKIPLLGGFRPKVIIRTAVGASKPLNPGPQHVQNYSHPFGAMLQTIQVQQLLFTEEIVPAYQAALERDTPTILVEHMSYY